MIILGIDTTAVTATAAVCEAENGVITNHSLFLLKNGLTHSENLLPIIDSVLKSLGKTPDDIGLVSVSVGPGSFTGVRIGVATAKGIAFAGDKPVCGVSTLEALAENCASFGGIVCPVMDARRHQFYNALFENGVRLCEDRCVSFEEIYADAMSYGKPVILCGDGARLFYSLCENKEGLVMPPLCAEDQNGLSVCAVSYRKYLAGEYTTHAELRPVYLRPSQAERERNAKL